MSKMWGWADRGEKRNGGAALYQHVTTHNSCQHHNGISLVFVSAGKQTQSAEVRPAIAKCERSFQTCPMTDDEWNEFASHVMERLANETAFSLDDIAWRNAFTFPRPHYDLLVATARKMNAPFSLESDFQAELGEAMVFTCRRPKPFE